MLTVGVGMRCWSGNENANDSKETETMRVIPAVLSKVDDFATFKKYMPKILLFRK